ncbi:hypothetical protein EON65_50880, partial [archaeon]
MFGLVYVVCVCMHVSNYICLNTCMYMEVCMSTYLHYGNTNIQSSYILPPQESKKGYLPLVDQEGNLKALTTRTDLKKNRAFPMASKDSHGKLLVGAAIQASARDPPDLQRVAALCAAGVNVLVLDAQNGDCDNQIDLIRLIKHTYPGVDVVAGNVVRVSQTRSLIEAGADALRVGMG